MASRLRNYQINTFKFMKSFKKGDLQFKKHSGFFLKKGSGGVIGIFNSTISLVKWMIAGPEIARMVSSFDEALNDYGKSTELYSHHKKTTSFENMFKKDFKSLKHEFEKVENPFFEDTEILYTLIRKM